MKILNTIQNVTKFGIFNFELIYYFGDMSCNHFNKKVKNFIILHDYLVLNEIDNSLQFYDNNFNLIFFYNDFIYPKDLIYSNQNLFLINQYDSNMNQSQAIFLAKNSHIERFVFENKLIRTATDTIMIGYIGEEVKAFSFDNKLIWQTDISHYGQKRYNHRNEEIDSSTPNTISGEVIGYEDTIVVPLSGKQIVALNIADGSFKWIIEYEKRQNYFAWHENRLYTYWRNFIHEIDICTGEIVRNLEVSSIYIDKYNDWPNRSLVSGGKLIIDFLKTDNSLLVIDLESFSIGTSEVIKSDAFLKANPGDVIWHNDKLYARDSLTNTLYVYG